MPTYRFQLFTSALLLLAANTAASGVRIPLATGLTIVTAVADRKGDYESIKRIVSTDTQQIRIHYSSQRWQQDEFIENDPGKLVKLDVMRSVRRVDLEKADIYLQQFASHLVEEIPGTTAIGISRAQLQALKTAGKAQITVFQTLLPGSPSNPLERQPGMLDYRLSGTISRVESRDVPVRVIVNDQPVDLPAVHAKGVLAIDQSDFFFLDDPDNPLTLAFDIGGDKLNVIKIAFPGELVPTAGQNGTSKVPGSSGGIGPGEKGAGEAPQIEQSLKETGHADVYGIYFDFDSAKIREESEPVLAQIAAVMKGNPVWRLAVNGHTDNIGGNSYNLDLSKRRAAAVKESLVSRYGIAPSRLVTNGLGAAQPKDTNQTLQGRARNRRVELVRL